MACRLIHLPTYVVGHGLTGGQQPYLHSLPFSSLGHTTMPPKRKTKATKPFHSSPTKPTPGMSPAFCRTAFHVMLPPEPMLTCYPLAAVQPS